MSFDLSLDLHTCWNSLESGLSRFEFGSDYCTNFYRIKFGPTQWLYLLKSKFWSQSIQYNYQNMWK